MDAKEQAIGEQRVRDHLIDPLRRLGLVKPSKVKVSLFEAGLRDLCKKLAYMSDLNLEALAEQVAQRAGGKDRDQFPIAKNILFWAGEIQAPPDDASPLIRAVFADKLGQRALAEGWAPELLVHLRRSRVWPKDHDVMHIHKRAEAARHAIAKQDERLARGAELSREDWTLREGRQAAEDKCYHIAALVAAEGAA